MTRGYKNMGGAGGRDTATTRYQRSMAQVYQRGRENNEQQPTRLSAHDLEIYLSQPYLNCLECGRDYKGLGYHISKMHLMTSEEYNLKHGLPPKTGLISRDVKAKLQAAQIATHANRSDKEKIVLNNMLKKGREKYFYEGKETAEFICEYCDSKFYKPLSYLGRAYIKGGRIKCADCRKKIAKANKEKYDNKLTETKATCFVCEKIFLATNRQVRSLNKERKIACSQVCKKLICQKTMLASGQVTKDLKGTFRKITI